jgi:translation elongation factor EF-1alpha
LKDEHNVQLHTKAGESAKPVLIVGVLGSYSTGKSTLIGRLLSDLAVFPSQGIHKIREAAQTMSKSNYYPWLVDTLKFEREEGIV